jgi:hypothetical protein
VQVCRNDMEMIRWAPPITEGSVRRLFHGPRTRKSDAATLIKILVGKSRGEIVALTRMQTKKPWPSI